MRNSQKAALDDCLNPNDVAGIPFVPLGAKLLVEPVGLPDEEFGMLAGATWSTVHQRILARGAGYDWQRSTLRAGDIVLCGNMDRVMRVPHRVRDTRDGDMRIVAMIDEQQVTALVSGADGGSLPDDREMEELRKTMNYGISEEQRQRVTAGMASPQDVAAGLNIKPIGQMVIVERCLPELLTDIFDLPPNTEPPAFRLLTAGNSQSWPAYLQQVGVGSFCWMPGVARNQSIPHRLCDKDGVMRDLYLVSINSVSAWYPGLSWTAEEAAMAVAGGGR